MAPAAVRGIRHQRSKKDPASARKLPNGAGGGGEGSAPGGSDCFSLSAFSASVTHSVYRYLLQRTLNFVTVFDFLIFTDCASFRRAVSRKSLISLICFGCARTSTRCEHKRG